MWEESGDVVKVFMTLLARKDSDHICRMTAYNIHKLCNLDEVEVLDILKLLASPDKRRKEQQEFDGRRIKAVEDGWLILNGAKYRDKVSQEMRKASWRRAQANSRAKKDGKPVPYPSARKIRKNHSISEEELAAHSEVQRSVQALDEIQGREELEDRDEAEFERIAAAPRRGEGEEVKAGVVWVKSVAQAVVSPARPPLTQPGLESPGGLPLGQGGAVPEVTISLDESPSIPVPSP